MRLPTFLLICLLTTLVLAAGCGGDDTKRPSAQTALTEIGNMRTALAQARKTFDQGDFKVAARQVGDAYLNHFENVEPALDKVDQPFRLKVEKKIRETLRGEVLKGSPPPAVHKLFDQITTDLGTAEAKLK
jgi:hypothetical protein